MTLQELRRLQTLPREAFANSSKDISPYLVQCLFDVTRLNGRLEGNKLVYRGDDKITTLEPSMENGFQLSIQNANKTDDKFYSFLFIHSKTSEGLLYWDCGITAREARNWVDAQFDD